jgi:hypothetical protein
VFERFGLSDPLVTGAFDVLDRCVGPLKIFRSWVRHQRYSSEAFSTGDAQRLDGDLFPTANDVKENA